MNALHLRWAFQYLLLVSHTAHFYLTCDPAAFVETTLGFAGWVAGALLWLKD